jgi:hypothetical protein
VSSVEVARRCAVGKLGGVLKVRRLMWFGHVRRGDEDGVLGRIVNVNVEGRRSLGRLNKSWRKCVDEDPVTVTQCWNSCNTFRNSDVRHS